ncbi:MltR family transcriptional regulator [Brevundimonas sp. BT-123]|uniref:MltR family transcriptional regulator n=1 Tax=Brevundimonas sp. BT-123 TaxID=2986928 RepID=UPI0022358671|nr:MltR family transcriptional regulator [Brevundimonas sp. BT-123]MCW0045458.1 MltR family transcriptional regulator [Brevundimonas sp. BT-123]
MTSSQTPDRPPDEIFGNLNDLTDLLADMDERGLVLSLAAFAEDALGDLIAAFLIPSNQSDSLLKGFNAPIGTFSARIKTAFALGLINQNQHDDLDRLRKIRNIFAHDWNPKTLTDPAVATHVSAINFGTLTEFYPETPIDKVRSAICDLLVELRSTTNQTRKKGFGAKLIGGHLIAGLVGTQDEQLAEGRARLEEIAAELTTATGDRRRFLEGAQKRWETKYAMALHRLLPT